MDTAHQISTLASMIERADPKTARVLVDDHAMGHFRCNIMYDGNRVKVITKEDEICLTKTLSRINVYVNGIEYLNSKMTEEEGKTIAEAVRKLQQRIESHADSVWEMMMNRESE